MNIKHKKIYLALASLVMFYAALHACLLYYTASNNQTKQSVAQIAKPPKDKYNIIFTTIPKSASVYIAKTLAQSLNYEQTDISLGYFPHDNITFNGREKSLQLFFGQKAQLTKNHMDASIFNTQLLEAKTDKIVVHFRDPRAVLLSWVHYLNRIHEERPFYLFYLAPTPPEVYYTWSLEQQIDWNIENFLPLVVNWMNGWLDYKIEKDKLDSKFKVLLTTYDEFMQDEVAFYHKILDFYGIPKQYFSFAPPSKNMEVHYRKGDPDEWRRVFTTAQQERINKMIPQKLFAYFNWKA